MSATISHIYEGTVAHEIGLQKGDVLLNIDGNPVQDVIDLMYHSMDSAMKLEVQRNDKKLTFKIKNRENSPMGA